MEQLHDYRDTDFRYLEIVIQGKHFYGEFLDGRVARNTVPQNLVVYNIRADTDLDHIPVSVENYVDRDFYGTIIFKQEFAPPLPSHIDEWDYINESQYKHAMRRLTRNARLSVKTGNDYAPTVLPADDDMIMVDGLTSKVIHKK